MSNLRKYLIFSFFSLLFLGGLFFYEQAKFSDNKLHVVFCNVGQGDGIYIRTPKGLDILIDGGPNDSILNCLGNHMPFWDRDLELVILTHPHADHVVGLISVLKRYTVLQFASQNIPNSTQDYKELAKLIKEKNIAEKILSKGDKFNSNDGLVLATKWPDFSPMVLGAKAVSFNQNESSIIELLSYGQFDVLLTGDADTDSIIEAGRQKNKIEILKISHHGSKTGTNKELLETIKPDLAVISVGKKNIYGLPYPKTLEILKELGIKTLRTDQDGEIEIISDGKSWSIQN